MGKMILDDLRKRLERLDEDADLMIDNNDRYQMVIVGGSAFILLGKLTRATHDIDEFRKNCTVCLASTTSTPMWKPTSTISRITSKTGFSRYPLVVQRCSSTHPVWKIW